MRVLYVDDDRVNALLFSEACRFASGVDVQTADSGSDALELVSHWRPDLLVIDLHLPDIPGEEVLRRLRGDARTARIPIVVVSADATPQSLDRLRAAGADAYLTKPLDVDEFLRVVETFLPALEAPSA